MATKKKVKAAKTRRRSTPSKKGAKPSDTRSRNKAKKSTKAAVAEKKTSALDAAAQVLRRSKKPMRTKELIEAMAKQSLWKSPGGKTPWATLYSSIIREIGVDGKDARFKKIGRGMFESRG